MLRKSVRNSAPSLSWATPASAIAVSLLVGGCSTGFRPEDCTTDSSAARDRFGSYLGGGVVSPMGSFTVIKTSRSVCAIKLTRVCRGGDSRQPTRFSDGAETVRADYFLVSAPGQSLEPLSQRERFESRGSFVSRASIGMGFHALPSIGASGHFSCGGVDVKWYPPNVISFRTWSNGSWLEDRTLLLAPTDIRSKENIAGHGERIDWYRVGRTTNVRLDLRALASDH